MRRAVPALSLALIAAPGLAHAYIGPGLGAGALAAAVGVVGSLFLALFAVIYYPIKRMRKKRRAATGGAGSDKTTKPAPGE